MQHLGALAALWATGVGMLLKRPAACVHHLKWLLLRSAAVVCLLAGVLQVADLIAMTLQVHKALPRSERNNQVSVDQYTMPTACRKRLKCLQWAPPICYSLPIDPTRTYKVTGCGALVSSVRGRCSEHICTCDWACRVCCVQ